MSKIILQKPNVVLIGSLLALMLLISYSVYQPGLNQSIKEETTLSELENRFIQSSPQTQTSSPTKEKKVFQPSVLSADQTERNNQNQEKEITIEPIAISQPELNHSALKDGPSLEEFFESLKALSPQPTPTTDLETNCPTCPQSATQSEKLNLTICSIILASPGGIEGCNCGECMKQECRPPCCCACCQKCCEEEEEEGGGGGE